MIERCFQSAKYEHLYRDGIDDGQQLDEQIARYLAVYNEIRPHEALDFARPLPAPAEHRPPRTHDPSVLMTGVQRPPDLDRPPAGERATGSSRSTSERHTHACSSLDAATDGRYQQFGPTLRTRRTVAIP